MDYLLVQGTKTLNKELREYGIIPFGGCQWWVLSSQAIEDIFHFIHDNREIYNLMLKKSFTPDETIIHTILMNSPSRDLISVNRQGKNNRQSASFCDFGEISGRIIQSHPYTLTMEDIDMLISARQRGYFFARKFDESVDTEVLDFIDEHVLVLASD